ncbi:MAG: cofactor-independent phosphoglycerate mutase [Deltaproteobacteria bacterium]|nr:MAG: cofactor-independent phosphoglycerate mutase [Deltaproteobacteria bacterium]
MADYPLDELGGKTPLQVAATPHMDRIAACRLGLVKTIPDGMAPGSDTANLTLLGYDPKVYHTGRAPLEAASMGVALEPNQVAFRMNLVTLDLKTDDEIIMVSHSSGDISTAEAERIVETLKQRIRTPEITIYQGVAYRHLLVWDNGPEDILTIPPHDVLDQNMAQYVNHSPDNPVPGLIRSSWEILKDHPVNVERKREGLKEANSIWLWGQGKALQLPLFKDTYGLEGGVICAVDLVRGIGIYAGFAPIHVEGATGYLDTNYLGKAEAALKALETQDFVLVHVEAPDEAGHSGNIREKIEAIEAFDEKVVGTVLRGLEEFESYRVLVVSDHFTPITKKTHTPEPTPFAWASDKELESTTKGPPYTEASAQKSRLIFEHGHKLMPSFLFGD